MHPASVLRPLTVAGSAIAATVLVGWASDKFLQHIDARHPETPLWHLLRRCRIPLQVVLCTGLLLGSYGYARVGRGHEALITLVLTLVLIMALAWLTVRVAVAIVQTGYARYASASHDAARVRRVRTQVTLIQRIVTAAVGVIAAAVMLMQFPHMRAVGTSVLASAGVIAAVAGIAAQSTLGNIFAGLQIAFGDMVRIGDNVVVEGEWGTVEEITLTYLVVSTWDERRITMPVSYFTSRPFENWTRGSAQMTGTVFFHLDHSTPVDLMREQLYRELKECDEWDGRAWGLVVTDTTPTTIQVRALVTAKDAGDIWTLRCTVRERLIDWLRREHPYALPRINTALGPGLSAAPDRGEQPRPSPDQIGPGPGAAPPHHA